MKLFHCKSPFRFVILQLGFIECPIKPYRIFHGIIKFPVKMLSNLSSDTAWQRNSLLKFSFGYFKNPPCYYDNSVLKLNNLLLNRSCVKALVSLIKMSLSIYTLCSKSAFCYSTVR